MVKNTFDLKKDVLAKELRGCILNGDYAHGEKLPVEVELAAELGVSRDTLRKALKVLEKERLLVRIRSKGTFVNLPSARDGKKILVLLKPSAGSDPAYEGHYLMPSMQQSAQEYGMMLELCPRSFIDDQDLEATAAMLRNNRELGGCVILEGRYNGKENYIRALQKSGLPVVMAVCHPGDVQTTGFAGVRTNSKKAWEEGILALKDAGHRRIAFFLPNWIQGYFEDLEGFYGFLRKHDLFDAELICNCPIEYARVEIELQRVMKLDEAPTAAICTSDFFAMLLMKVARKMKIQIPQQLSVMGYCGYPGGKFLKPPLSTVDFRYEEIGKKVIEVLARADQWFGKKDVAPPEIIMPHEVVIRESAMMRRVEPLFV
jgi:GntR family transcriptional regulator of arabinose operon